MYPREKITVYINEELDNEIKDEELGYSIQAFEYILFNNEDNVTFKGSVEDYKIDYLNSRY